MTGLVEVPVRLGVELRRVDEHANRPCAACGQRRVRYRIAVISPVGGADETAAMCLECWTGDDVLPTMSAVERTDAT